MINFLIDKIYDFISFIINLFPEGTGFSTETHTAFQTLGGYLKTINLLVPLDTLKICLLLIFSVEISLFTFKTIKWIISHIPQIGGKGV